MKKKVLITVVFLLCAVFALHIDVGADVGNFAGNSDYGYHNDYDYDYDDDETNDYGLSGGDFWVIVLGTLIVYLVVICGQKSKGKGKKNATSAQRSKPNACRTDDEYAPIDEYTEIDPNFSSTALCEKAASIYVQMQNCWTAKDIEPIRPYFTDALFTQMERALRDIVRRGETNIVERIAVLEVTPIGFRQSGSEDIITVRLQTRITDYTINDRTQEIVSGSRDHEKFMTYEWDMLRPSGIATNVDTSAVKRISCLSCGAPLDMNASARCPYCGSVIRRQAQDWVISAIRGIRQRTR